jgi:hypothetical protein
MSNVPNQVNINEDTPNQVLINQDSPNQVLVRGGGIGGTSANTRRLEFVQGSASATWVITHTLGGRPSVTIVDSADTHVFGEVQYNSNTQITVTFSAAFSGKAYLT